VTRTLTESPWTPEDRALLLAYRQCKASIHEPCGVPVEKAFNPEMRGYYEATDDEPLICWACTAIAAKDHEGPEPVKPVVVGRHTVIDTRDYDANPLPPWALSA
jgi:hypothetical protein